MPISEPVTMLTDYLIFGQSMLLAWYLHRSIGDGKNQAKRFWTWALLAVGLASLFGGTYHGFSLVIPKHLNVYLWQATTMSIGFVSCFMVVGTVLATVKPPWRNLLILVSAAQLLFYLGWMTAHDEFLYVILNYVPSMVLVFALQAIAFVTSRSGSEGFIMSGIIVSFVGAGVQQSGFALHQHFNHNDLYHVIQMLGIYLLYRGALRLQDREATR